MDMPHDELLCELWLAAHRSAVNVRSFSCLSPQIPVPACSVDKTLNHIFGYE